MEHNLGILKDTKNKMQRAINVLNSSLSSIRTGRANPSLLHPLKVSAYGNEVLINQIASISAPDAKTLVIQIWDKELIPSVQKAILNSGLGLTANTEGQVLRLNIPNLSEERRKQLVKKVGEYSEQGKISIRNIRRNSIDLFKKQEKDKCISKDELKDYLQEVQKITSEFTSRIDNILESKSRDVMSI